MFGFLGLLVNNRVSAFLSYFLCRFFNLSLLRGAAFSYRSVFQVFFLSALSVFLSSYFFISPSVHVLSFEPIVVFLIGYYLPFRKRYFISMLSGWFIALVLVDPYQINFLPSKLTIYCVYVLVLGFAHYFAGVKSGQLPKSRNSLRLIRFLSVPFSHALVLLLFILSGLSAVSFIYGLYGLELFNRIFSNIYSTLIASTLFIPVLIAVNKIGFGAFSRRGLFFAPLGKFFYLLPFGVTGFIYLSGVSGLKILCVFYFIQILVMSYSSVISTHKQTLFNLSVWYLCSSFLVVEGRFFVTFDCHYQRMFAHQTLVFVFSMAFLVFSLNSVRLRNLLLKYSRRKNQLSRKVKILSRQLVQQKKINDSNHKDKGYFLSLDPDTYLRNSSLFRNDFYEAYSISSNLFLLVVKIKSYDVLVHEHGVSVFKAISGLSYELSSAFNVYSKCIPDVAVCPYRLTDETLVFILPDRSRSEINAILNSLEFVYSHKVPDTGFVLHVGFDLSYVDDFSSGLPVEMLTKLRGML